MIFHDNRLPWNIGTRTKYISSIRIQFEIGSTFHQMFSHRSLIHSHIYKYSSLVLRNKRNSLVCNYMNHCFISKRQSAPIIKDHPEYFVLLSAISHCLPRTIVHLCNDLNIFFYRVRIIFHRHSSYRAYVSTPVIVYDAPRQNMRRNRNRIGA